MPSDTTQSNETGFSGYHRLMRNRVVDVLLVASPYDRFILEEDGQFSDRIFSEYLELNLSDSPRFKQVSTAKEALAHLGKRSHSRVDMVITTPHCVDMPALELGQTIKAKYPEIPVVMLSYDRVTARSFAAQGSGSPFEEVYFWSGDPRLLMAMVKNVEDRLNVSRDTRVGDVRVILVVEDSPDFYSSYLPIIYTEVLKQTHSLMSDVMHSAERMYRMRARPKILLARTYEGARQLLRRYRENLLGLVVDMRFPRKGRLDPGAGEALIAMARKRTPDLPVLIQSAEPDHQEVARRHNVDFADKSSPELLATVRRFMHTQLGFGPFIFRTPAGWEVDRAHDMDELVECLVRVPAESIRYHGERNHFSNWLMARSLFALAHEVRPRAASDFESDESLREYLLGVFGDFLDNRQRGQITSFRRGTDPLSVDFTRIGGGSLGGKARGLAFVSSHLAHHPIHERFPDHNILVPRTAVICADVFDRFVARNNLRERAMAARSDDEVSWLFLSQPLEDDLMADLSAMLAEVRYPIAVRSSSLLEDSAFQPFAGLYRTIMLPNSSKSDRRRLEQFIQAIRLVMASTFFRGPRAFMDATGIRMEEQSMAVVIQQLVGTRHGDLFYPDFAGVAQSHNFYPIRFLKPEDGIATVALGLGQLVVDGGKALRFCPRHPGVLPQMSTVSDVLKNSQREFYALDLSNPDLRIDSNEMTTIRRLGLDQAEKDGTLAAVGATYSADNNRIVDSIYGEGPRVVNFAQVLKYGRFPLADMLNSLLQFGREGLGTAVEMEFAAHLDGDDGRPELAILQLRPLVAEAEFPTTNAAEVREGETRIMAGTALGNGAIMGIRDAIIVSPAEFEAARTRTYAQEIARINARLTKQSRPYMLLGPGRWGTSDPWLGIPVTWPAVSGARVIVELAIPGFRIDPSQGTHFFHNITSLRVGYFTIDITNPAQRLDLDWFLSIPPESVQNDVRHVRLPQPVQVRIDGRSGQGIAIRAPCADPPC